MSTQSVYLGLSLTGRGGSPRHLSGQAQDGGSGVGVQAEAEALEVLDDRPDRGEVPRGLGAQENSQRARERDPEETSMAAGQAIVEESQRLLQLSGEREYLPFAGTEIGGDAEEALVRSLPHVNPVQLGRVGQCDSARAPDIELAGDGLGDQDRTIEPGKKLEEVTLVEVLERRGVGDHLRHAPDPPSALPR
jgi:hypothetical protein